MTITSHKTTMIKALMISTVPAIMSWMWANNDANDTVGTTLSVLITILAVVGSFVASLNMVNND